VRSKYCAAWAASHKHQGYPTCYGVALACQQDLDRTSPITVPYSAPVPVLQQKREIFLTSRTGSDGMDRPHSHNGLVMEVVSIGMGATRGRTNRVMWKKGHIQARVYTPSLNGE
jgi:hypothetical protein